MGYTNEGSNTFCEEDGEMIYRENDLIASSKKPSIMP